jgi:hypothetical protein
MDFYMPDVSITDTFLLHFWRKQEVLCRMLLPMDSKKDRAIRPAIS